MKRVVAGTVLLAALAASPAFAEQGFEAGASVGYSKIEFSDQGVSFNFDDIGYKIFAGYMFTDNFGLEGGWVDFGNPSKNIQGLNAKIEADGFDLFAVGGLPVSDTIDLFAKAGVISWDAKATIEGLGSDSTDGNDLALGFGGRFKTGTGWGIRAEYEWFDIEDTDSVWMLSVGFDYTFK